MGKDFDELGRVKVGAKVEGREIDGEHPLFVPGYGDEQGKGKGRQEMKWGEGSGHG